MRARAGLSGARSLVSDQPRRAPGTRQRHAGRHGGASATAAAPDAQPSAAGAVRAPDIGVTAARRRADIMANTAPQIEDLINREYEAGFYTDIEADTIPSGLNEDIIRLISEKKSEPPFMLEWRLKAFRNWLKM